MNQARTISKAANKDLDRAWKLLNQLAETLTRISAAPPSAGASVSRAGAQGKRRNASNKAALGLPDTTGDFFAKHVSKRKQTASQIYQSVIDSLDFTPSKEQSAILRNRLAVWLSNAVKSDSTPVSSIGNGKDRRYFKG